MRAVRTHNPAWPFLTVQRESDDSFRFQPEVARECLPQRSRALAETVRDAFVAEAGRDIRDIHIGGIHVALHFGEGDRRNGQFTIGMRNRIVGILPTLICQPARRLAYVFDVAVAVRIAPSLYPFKRAFHVWPEFFGKSEISGSRDIAPQQPEKKGGRVDAAVVTAEWNFSGSRHFAAPHF